MPINVQACRTIATCAVDGNFGGAIPFAAGANANHRIVTQADARVTLTPLLNPATGLTSLGPATAVGGDTFFLPYAWDVIYSMELPTPANAILNGTTSFLTANISGCKFYVDAIVGGNGAVVIHHANNVTNPPPLNSLPTVETAACTNYLDNLHAQARGYYQGPPHNLNLPLAQAGSVGKPQYNLGAEGEVLRKRGQGRNQVDFTGGTMVFGVVNGAKWDAYWVTWGAADYNRPIYSPKGWVKGLHHAPAQAQSFRVLGSGLFF